MFSSKITLFGIHGHAAVRKRPEDSEKSYLSIRIMKLGVAHMPSVIPFLGVKKWETGMAATVRKTWMEILDPFEWCGKVMVATICGILREFALHIYHRRWELSKS